jgi:calcineurin-like phosphoesterase family protein
MKIFATSDTHFGHKRIIEICPGRAKWGQTVPEMDQHIVDCWNQIATEQDLVIHMGDYAFGTKEQRPQYRQRLRANILLVCGNHDPSLTACRAQLGPNDLVCRRLAMVLDGQMIVARHRYDDMKPEDDHAHQFWVGHQHDRPTHFPANVRVWGVDIDGPTPIKVGETTLTLKQFYENCVTR